MVFCIISLWLTAEYFSLFSTNLSTLRLQSVSISASISNATIRYGIILIAI